MIAFVLSADTENDPDVAGHQWRFLRTDPFRHSFPWPHRRRARGLVNGSFCVIPTYSEMRDSLLNIMVVGTADGIVMVESGAKEVKEETVVDAIEFAHARNQEDLRRDQ